MTYETGKKRGPWHCCHLLSMKRSSTMYNKELGLRAKRGQPFVKFLRENL